MRQTSSPHSSRPAARCATARATMPASKEHLIWLNDTWASWEKARHAFHRKLEKPAKHLSKSSQYGPYSHDAFAGHLLLVHRLHCTECEGDDVPILPNVLDPAPDHGSDAQLAVKGTLTVTELAKVKLRVSYHKTCDAETQTPPENETSSTTDPPTPDLGTDDDKPVQDAVALHMADMPLANESQLGVGSVTVPAENKIKTPPHPHAQCEERQSSAPSVSSALTMQQNVGSQLVPEQQIIHRDKHGKFVSVNPGRKKTKREQYWERKRRRETQDILDAPRKKKEKRCVPKEKQPVCEPRKSERIKQRIESHANSLEGFVFSLPTSTPRDDEDDGWIEDDPSSKSFEESKQGESPPGSSFKSSSDLGDVNKRDADGVHIPVTKSMSTSNCKPKNNSRCVDSQSDSNSRSLSDCLQPSKSKDKDNPHGSYFGRSRWVKRLKPVTIPEFRGPPPGPTTKLSPQEQEITFFHLLFPPELIKHLVVNSNYFAARWLITAGSFTRWTPFTVGEMKAFLALQLLMSVKKNPDLSSYWSQECSFEGVSVREVMSHDRFQAFLAFFQPCECSFKLDKRAGNHDRKGCKILDIINDCCRLQYSPHRDCTVHETTVNQNLGSAPRIHVLLLVDSANGYCSEFQVCPPLKESKDHCQSRNSVVVDLTQGLQKKNHIINLSESFVNLELLKTLEVKGILCRGAIDSSHLNKLNLPGQLFSRSITRNVIFQQGNITACSWYNTVCRRRVISSADDPKGAYEIVQTHKGKSRISRCPKAVVHHMKSLYAKPFSNPCPTQGRSFGRDKCIFWFAFDVVIANAFILKHGSGCTLEGMKSFRQFLALQLIKSNSHQGDFQPSVVTSDGDAQPRTSYSDSGLCNAQPVKPSDSIGVHAHRAIDNIQPARPSDGINVQYAQQSESTIDDAHLGGPTDGTGMQTQAIHSDNSHVNIQISRVTSGFSMPSYILHADNTNENVEPPRSNDGIDMHSHSQHSDSTDLNIRISKVTGGLGMQSQTLHSSSTSESFSSVRLPDTQSQALHSDNTSEDVKPLLSNDGINMLSHSLHSGSASGKEWSVSLTDDFDMQSQALHSDTTSEDVKPLLSNDGINMHSHSLYLGSTSGNSLPGRLTDGLDMQSQTLHSANTNDNIHSAVPADGSGVQSPSCSSPVAVQPTKLVHSYDDIAKKVKEEPCD